MGEESMIDGVRSWLEQGGYVLEMQVARKATARTNLVFQGYHYTDPLTGKEREGDVSAFMVLGDLDDHTHAMQWFIECKNSATPWVFFLGGSGGNGPWTPTFYFDEECEFCHALDNEYADFNRSTPTAYAVTEKRTVKGSGSDKDLAYEAVHQVTSAVLAHYAEDSWDEHLDTSVISHMAVTIVVTQSPLITCRPDESGQVLLDQLSGSTC